MSVAEPVSAADSIPETPGWGGFVIAAFGFASLRGNTMAGNRTFDVSCLFRPGGGGNHQVRPRARYTVDNRDGDAVAGDSIWLQLTHGYFTPGYWVISNIAYGKTNRDARSPIFGVKTDPDRYVLDTTLFVRLNVLGPGWQGVGSLSWGKEDSSVNFYDSDLVLASVGLLYRFGAR